MDEAVCRSANKMLHNAWVFMLTGDLTRRSSDLAPAMPSLNAKRSKKQVRRLEIYDQISVTSRAHNTLNYDPVRLCMWFNWHYQSTLSSYEMPATFTGETAGNKTFKDSTDRFIIKNYFLFNFQDNKMNRGGDIRIVYVDNSFM